MHNLVCVKISIYITFYLNLDQKYFQKISIENWNETLDQCKKEVDMLKISLFQLF